MSTTSEPEVWTASDLARARTTIIDEAERSAAFVRTSGGTLLVITRAERLSDLEHHVRIAHLLAKALRLHDTHPNPTDLGELAFTASWDAARRSRFADDLADVAVHALATRNPTEIDTFLDASRPRAASGIVDPARLARLLTPPSV